MKPFHLLSQDGHTIRLRFDERDCLLHLDRKSQPACACCEATANADATGQPRHPEAVCSDMAMKWARALRAVEVDLISIGDAAELGEVEICVAALQRVERPGDACEALSERLFALG